MAESENTDSSMFHQPLLSETQPQSSENVEVLAPFPPAYHRGGLSKSCRCGVISCAIALIFLVASFVLLWPSKPQLSIVQLSLNGLGFHTVPSISLDVKLKLTVQVRNQDFYSIKYDWLNVTIDYRGQNLANATSEGGLVNARSSSYVNATLDVDAVEVLSDVVMLVEDVAAGEITLDTESKIGGKIIFFFFDLPLKATISCQVIANMTNETVSSQNCYPEVHL
ncbi:hypothetical protein F511_06111 [Dorcoceras hygrometricum]|uniref:Late embryogenesis abundant protein LEA-2 subgroup domain-containing protein n=1 Tax=Dorcoceras hygrometricum TaxID=472368 RepID=A0A2Z7DFA8_9LAMI|nr:hypothetical protein F511_06111 [Dorcoceras hygrometricum]